MTHVQPFGCKMPSYASDRPVKLSDAQAFVLFEVLTQCEHVERIHVGGTVFIGRDNQDNGRRRTLLALARAGKVAEMADPSNPNLNAVRVKRPEALAAYRAWYAKRGAQFSTVAAL